MSSRLSRILAVFWALWCAACDSSTERLHAESDAEITGEAEDSDAATDDWTDRDRAVGAEDGTTESDADGALDAGATDARDVDATAQAPIDGAGLDAACADCAVADAQTSDAMGPSGADASLTYVPIPNPTPLTAGDGTVLPFRVADAEYSDALDRIVLVTSPPNRLVLLDPESLSLAEVGLPLTPTSVSVAPDGLTAAVGHNHYVTIVALPTLSVLHTYPLNADPSDVVLAGNGYVYAFPRVSGWVELHSIEVGSGTETTSGQIYAGAVARLHPAGDRIYGAERGISPADVQRYDITRGTATVAYDSPYHGDFNVCGNLWMSQDGARIFTACGSVFRASNVRDEDMRYGGSLAGAASVRHLDHSSAAQLIATVHGAEQVLLPPASSPSMREVAIYEARFLNERRRITLPSFQAGGKQYASQGRYVFFNAKGTRLYVLVQAEPAAPMSNNEGLARFSLGGAGGGAGVIDVTTEPLPVTPASGTPSAGVSLGFRVIDAEYSRPLERIVAVSNAPDRLLIVNPANGTADKIALPLAPSAVSLHPEGHQAAVAHDGWISIVDLDQRSVAQTLPVSAPLGDVVLGRSGYVYGFPSRDQLVDLHSVRIADAQVTRSASISANAHARLHPAGDRMYVMTGGTKRYDVAGGVATFAYEAQSDAQHSTCGNLWFSEDGLRIFTPCGNVFRASNDRGDDMLYLGALQGSVGGSANVAHLAHSQAAAHLAVAIQPAYGATSGTGVTLFDHQSLSQVGTQPGPSVTLSGTSYATNSRFVFFNAAGTKLYLLSDPNAAPIVASSILTELAP